jgi:hypothetical protein
MTTDNSAQNLESDNTNVKPMKKLLTSVKIPNELFEKISKSILDTIKVDKYTKKILTEKIIKAGHYSYIGLIKKHAEFLTPIRVMILVDYVDILKAFKYYLNHYGYNNYDKTMSKDYNLISGLQAAELKLILLEQLYEIFEGSTDLGIILHEPEEKIDAMIEVKEPVKINLSDNEGYVYIYSINSGKHVFESRSCCSISDAKYILNSDKRIKYSKEYDKYFLFVPKDTTIFTETTQELDRNNIKILFSNYSTIDIVNDVAFMEGIMKPDNS